MLPSASDNPHVVNVDAECVYEMRIGRDTSSRWWSLLPQSAHDLTVIGLGIERDRKCGRDKVQVQELSDLMTPDVISCPAEISPSVMAQVYRLSVLGRASTFAMRDAFCASHAVT